MQKMVLVQSKPFYASKTVWVGIVTVLIAVAQYLVDVPLFEAYREPVAAVLGVLVIVGRFLGDRPVTMMEKPVQVQVER